MLYTMTLQVCLQQKIWLQSISVSSNIAKLGCRSQNQAPSLFLVLALSERVLVLSYAAAYIVSVVIGLLQKFMCAAVVFA